MIFADEALSTPLLSNNIQVVLAFIVIVLAGVVVALYRENRQQYEKRLQDKVDTLDKYNEAMGETARTVELLTTKLKGGG